MNNVNLKKAGDFLRAKRESTSPQSVGLIIPSRTRTKGLRREDVAYLSGISAIWYSKIERGKAIGVSSQSLMAISQVLQLNKLEYEYLCNLIIPRNNYYKEPSDTSSELTFQLLFQLNPIPALLMNDYLDIIACNQSFELMIGFTVSSLPNAEKNYLHLTLNHSDWQKFLCIDTKEQLTLQLTRMAGFFRTTLARLPDDVILKDKIAAFRELSCLFTAAWEENNVLQPEDASYIYNHNILGKMTLSKQLWWNTNEDRSCRLNIYHAKNQSDAQRLRHVCEKL